MTFKWAGIIASEVMSETGANAIRGPLSQSLSHSQPTHNTHIHRNMHL